MKKSATLAIAIILFISAFSQKPLTIQDYPKWSRIVSVEISNDGNWMTFGRRPNGGDDTLYIKNINTDKVFKVKYADAPKFSEDNKWVSYTIKPNEAEEKKLKKAKQPVNNKAGLLNLATGKREEFDRHESSAFSNNSLYLAVLRKKPSKDESSHKGKDLVLRNLQTGEVTNIGNVGSFAFNKKSTILAYTVDADDKLGNGVYMMTLATGMTKALDTDTLVYSNLTWDDDDANRNSWNRLGNNFAVLKGQDTDSTEHRKNSIVVLSNVGSAGFKKKTYSTEALTGFPKKMVVSENGSLNFSNDATTLFFGIREQEKKVKLGKDTVANVDVWHWNDEYIQSVQMRRASRDERFTYTCALDLNTGKFNQLANEPIRQVLLSKNNLYVIGRDEQPYREDINWGVTPADLYRINVKTGQKEVFAKKVKRPLEFSPDGRYYLFQLDTALQVYDLNSGKTTNISKVSGVTFMNLEHPYPHEKPPFGVAGWTKDGANVIVNHKYDLYMLALNGSKATNITMSVGDKEEIQFRYESMNPDEEYIDQSKPLTLGAYGEWTKKSGYYSLTLGKTPKALLYEDKRIGRPIRARNADRVIFTQQTFVDYPDYYSSTTDFKRIKRLTEANPQQKEYAWGRRVLVDYTNSRGIKLQATLTLPAGYKEGEKYPMLVYFYEKMSQNHHDYSEPVYDDRPHMSLYASNGYLVLMPDNVYEEGRPGTSSLDCITSAVKKVIDMGYADPKHIGLQGHSWGGYQSSFIVTQTDLFACVVTGAPPTNLESFYNNIYGNTGTNHHGIMEIGQVRMGRDVTPWSSREVYQRESPMFHAPNIKTPFMILHGTSDGAVDWSQGLEFYNAARRLGKEVIFVSYPNEGHHLTNEANQKDFLVRMQQYFDHYLKEKPAPDWMVEGIPQLKKLYNKAK